MKQGKTIIFIDGANLFHVLKKVGYLERDIHWENLFSEIVKQADPDTSFWRAHWYIPGRLSDLILYPGLLHSKRPNGMSVDDFRRECENWYMEEETRLRKQHQEVFGRIAEDFPRIDFKFVGVLKVDPIQRKRHGEKGVDIGLALDLADPTSDFDTAVILSGDFDFHPAIQRAKSHLKNIVVAPFVHGDPAKFDHGAARGLRRLADKVVPIYEKDLNDPAKGFLRDYKIYRPCVQNDPKNWHSFTADVSEVSGGKWKAQVNRENSRRSLEKLETDFSVTLVQEICSKECEGATRHDAVKSLYGVLKAKVKSIRSASRKPTRKDS